MRPIFFLLFIYKTDRFLWKLLRAMIVFDTVFHRKTESTTTTIEKKTAVTARRLITSQKINFAIFVLFLKISTDNVASIQFIITAVIEQ